MRTTVTIALAGTLALAGCGDAGGKLEYPPGSAEAPPPASGAAAAEAPKAPQDVAGICAGAEKVDVKVTSAPAAPPPGRAALSGDRAVEKGFAFQAPGAANAKGDRPYTMADLKALEGKGSWQEILQHVGDVPPAQRNAAWDALLDKAATSYLASLTNPTEAFRGLMAAESARKQYPSLEKSAGFMQKRGEVGKAAFGECFKGSYSGEECIRLMTDFVKAGPKSPELALAFGKLVRQNQNHYVAVPFFQLAVEGTKDGAACGDEDLRLAVVAGLGLPPDYDGARGARDIAANACWTRLKDPVENELKKNGAGYYKTNACGVLRAKGVVK